MDKQGHPIIRPCSPDFVLHQPGDMNGNFVAIEVKPINGRLDGIRKDLDTLLYFLSREVGYKVGTYLVYVEDDYALEVFKREVLSA
jgi:hypothetical protein